MRSDRNRSGGLRCCILVLALTMVLAGCGPSATAIPPAATAIRAASPTTAPGAAVPTPAPLAASPVPAPTAMPSSPLPTPTTMAISPLPTGTSMAASPLPTPGGPASSVAGMVVQFPNNSIQLLDGSGKGTLLYQATGPADTSSIFPPGNGDGSSVYVPLNGPQPLVVRATASGGEVLNAITGTTYGIAASSGKLAVGTADLNATPPIAHIMLAQPDGSQGKAIVEEKSASGQVPHVLRPARWSPDGRHLYFGKEPLGLGGYILFSGLTDLWSYDTATGKATELMYPQASNALVCIDDLAPDGKLTADHCDPKAMEIIDGAAQKVTAVKPPAEVPTFGAVGGARFSPDSAQLAYALARQNPDDEQGWVAVADVATGTSRLVATSPAKDYFSVAGWLGPQTLILQSAGQTPGVWTVGVDGSGLTRVTDGTFVGMLGSPATR